MLKINSRNITYTRALILLSFFLLLPVQGFSESLRRVCVKRTDDLSTVLAGENTRYIIHHNHDLSRYKNCIVIGKGSVLEFKRGSLNNGLIIFNNTKIKAKTERIFGNNNFRGTIDVATAYPEWFGAVGDGKTDDTQAIQDAIDVSNSITGANGRVYAVKTDTPFKHCLTVKRDSLSMSIHLKDINTYTTSDHRGRGVIFLENRNGFSFEGSITSVNDNLTVSAKTGMSLEGSRAGIVCYGDCGGLNINLDCSNLYCGITNGTFMYDEYLYRNGTVGVNHSNIKVKAYRVAYPVALNYANHCEIDVYGEHMHRCVYLCGDYNTVSAKGRNYYATAAPAHIILFSNVLKNDGKYRIVTCNYNNVTYTQLEGETENLPEGSVFQFQELGLSLNNKFPHTDYSFIGNTVNLYCCKVGGKNIQHLYKSFASNWKYDKKVNVECVFNIYGDISSYLSYSTFVFYANTEDKITINNHADQQLIYTFSYAGNPRSIYEINGDSRSRAFGTAEHPFNGTVRAKGRNVYVNTKAGNPTIKGNIFAEGENVEVIQDNKAHARHVHINSK